MVVDLYPDYTALTAVGLDGLRTARPGRYMASFGVPEGRQLGAGYVQHAFEATAAEVTLRA